MTSIAAVLVLISVVLLVIELTVQLLVATDLPERVARLQTWSLLTGTGYTTRESELIVGHPLRRRFALFLMLASAFGFVALLTALVTAFVGAELGEALLRLSVLVGVGTAEAYLLRTTPVKRLLRRVARWMWRRQADRGATYLPLAALGASNIVAGLVLTASNTLVGESVGAVGDGAPNVIVLGLRRGTAPYVVQPPPLTVLEAGDILVLHGPEVEVETLREERSDDG